MLKNCLDVHKTQLHDAWFANDDIVFFNEDTGNATFLCGELGILSVDLNNINLDDANFDKEQLFMLEFWVEILIDLHNINHLKKK